ncbi:MAG TPA: hypothetical protein VEY09_03045 [Pyrinomonadaceae bacterium]|nr:hypothetical protein [Pyrinomonadaceae bacterium]
MTTRGRDTKGGGRGAGRRGLAALAALCVLAACLVFAFASRRLAEPELQRPRRASTGSPQINVRAGEDLQAALDMARPGDTIVLEAGATYVGPFTLPVKQGDGWITIQSSAVSQLPEGVRVTAAQASLMPKLVSPGRNEPALRTAPGAHHFRLVGLEVKPRDAKAHVSELVQFGDGSSAQNSPEKIPHSLVLDRCYVHGEPEGTLKRAVALNSGAAEILNSHVSDAKAKGFDTQAVCGWNGPGPYRIVNNYLEGAGENVMFGGADASVRGLVPSDIEVVGNRLSKPPSWRGVWTVKNLFELKNARRVRIEGNLFENNWADGQTGVAILFTVRNQDGGNPWAVVEDVEFTNNVVRRAGGGLSILGTDDLRPSQTTRRIKVVNNLFDEIDGRRYGGHGLFVLLLGGEGVEMAHNTVFQSQHIILASGRVTSGFVFRDNLVMHNDYGVFGDDAGVGPPAFARYMPGAVFKGNLLVGAPNPSIYPPGNYFPPSLGAAGLTAPSGGDYRVSPASPFRRRASDGTDPGCDFDALEAAMKDRR